MSMFFLISQSLRTGEPLHQAQYKNLADRLHYHGGLAATAPGASAAARKTHLKQSLTSYEYMFYATAVVAVLQVVSVSDSNTRVPGCACSLRMFRPSTRRGRS